MSDNQTEQKRRVDLSALSVLCMLLLPALGTLVLQALCPYQQRFDESVYFSGTWFTAIGIRFFWNYLILFMIYAVLYVLPFFKVTSILLNIAVFLFGIAEHFVVLFRNSIIYPWDLDSMGLAANVSGTYDFKITSEMWIAFFLLLLMIGLSLYAKKPELPVWVRAIAVVLILISGSCYMNFFIMNRSNQIKSGIKFFYTQVNANYENGVLLTFCYHLQFLINTPPEGYDRTTVENELLSYDTSIDSVVPDGVKPDVILIMSEAFSDLNVISEFATNEPAMPFWDSLKGQDNCIQKTLLTSSFGGNTANSEFEFLTGMSLRFFTPGTYPYKHYVRNDVSSIASILGDNGYNVYSAHPFDLTGWNRKEVMPLLGFPVLDGEEAFFGATRYRTYISDQSAYEYLISNYESMKKNDPEKPVFEYLMTIQNHGGYAADVTLPYAIQPVTENDYPQAEQYLSLLRMTDEALAMLISYFEQVDHPTVIILYGDHQPNLLDDFQDYLKKSDDSDDPFAPLKKYETQLLVWANYDISQSELARMEDEMISNNYVSSYLSDIIGVDRTPLQAFEAEMHDAISVMNHNYLVTSDGDLLNLNTDTLPQEVELWLKKYENYQHYGLYDEKPNR